MELQSAPSIHVAAEASYSDMSRTAIAAIQAGLEDPRCTQIDGYGPGKFSVQFDGTNKMLEGVSFLSEEEYISWLQELVRASGSVVTWEQLEEDRMGVLDLSEGSRMAIFLPPVTRFFPTFSLRKHTAAHWQAEDLVANRTLDKRMMLFLQSTVAARVNTLFVGGMGSGKSTMMRALLQGAGDNERIAVVEQVPELGLDKPLASEYIYQPTIEGFRLNDVLDFNLYNGLDRLVVGEIHLDGITKMLETMILTEGSMSTYHSFSTEQAGERMKLALQLENHSVSAQTAISYIRQAIEMVVVLEITPHGRRVVQITEIDWRSNVGKESLAGADVFLYNQEKDIFYAKNQPNLGRITSKLKKYGVSMNSDWFIEKADLERFQRRNIS